jgi:hypothetical protein
MALLDEPATLQLNFNRAGNWATANPWRATANDTVGVTVG